MSRPCPLCNSRNTEHYSDHMEHILLEDYFECKDCGYLYDYLCGSTREVIKDKTFQWSYQATPENKKEEQNAIKYFELHKFKEEEENED
jgi:transposase-like protein